MQIADRLYERLSPEERFRAAAEAFARKDLAEIDRLNDTCPMETVRIQSCAYFGRLRGFHELAMMHGILVRDLLIGIWISAFRLSKSGALQIDTAEANSEANVDDSSATEVALEVTDCDDEVINALQTLVGRLKAYRGAWAQFCESIGVDPATTLFACHPESAEIAELCDMIEIDSVCQAEVLDDLQKSWALRESRSETRTRLR